MSIAGVNSNLIAPVAGPSEVSPDKAAENRPIIQAVKAVNGAEMFGHDKQLRYQRDPDSKVMVLQVVDRKTNEVVAQIPPEYVLRLAEDLRLHEAGAPSARTG